MLATIGEHIIHTKQNKLANGVKSPCQKNL